MSPETVIKYPRRTAKKAETRRRIINAALALLAEQGSTDVTIQAVADRADVHVTTLFTHFANKTELFVALSEPVIEVLEQTVAAARERGEPFFEFLEAAQESYATMLQVGGKSRADQSLQFRSQAELLPAWLKYENRQLALFTDYLATETGLEARRAALIAGMVLSANITAYDRWLDDPVGFDLVSAGRWNTREIRRMVDLLLAGNEVGAG